MNPWMKVETNPNKYRKWDQQTRACQNVPEFKFL